MSKEIESSEHKEASGDGREWVKLKPGERFNSGRSGLIGKTEVITAGFPRLDMPRGIFRVGGDGPEWTVPDDGNDYYELRKKTGAEK